PKIENGSSRWLRQEEAVKIRSPLVRVILDLWPIVLQTAVIVFCVLRLIADRECIW
ncbi:hypothetical protein CPB83DRAFT_861936, partial [Crepidotus variabilis]